MTRMSIDDAQELYSLHLWGAGFFGISDDGELTVRPSGEPGVEVSLPRLVANARARGLRTPMVVRFPQILASRVETLVDSFKRAMTEFGVKNGIYQPAFPIKVNQRREVVEALVAAGRDHGICIEVGSRPELMAALAMDLGPTSMILINGYKDRDTFRLATLGARMGRRVIVILEKLFELEQLLKAFDEAGPGALPEVGMRARLYARGAGKWYRSAGLASKFGLTTTGMLVACDRLRAAGRLDRLTTLHFHIGSQIPEIRRLKTAFREAARIYAKLRKRQAPLTVLNIGGGLAVDYDGSKTASDASMNYSVQEYANDAVFLVQEICDEENVPFPTIVSESGRALAAYHSVLVTDVLDVIAADPAPTFLRPDEDMPRLLQEMMALEKHVTVKNYREYFHDAGLLREEMATLFNVGIASLEQRAMAQHLFWEISRKALGFARKERIPIEEFEELERALDEKYVCNFSVFQSVPDYWALTQLFPIMPITRLREKPTREVTLVDITCDSDGAINHFIDIRDVRDSLPLHELRPDRGEPYDIAIFLVGAYQDVMGDMHNLFGAPDEVHVVVEPDGGPRILKVRRGDTAGHVLDLFGYPPSELRELVSGRLSARASEGELSNDERDRLTALYMRFFDEGTYLSHS